MTANMIDPATFQAPSKSKELARSKLELTSLFAKAVRAGEAAAKATTPEPMIVGTPSTPFGNDLDPRQPVYVVPGGVCGFAWVKIRPGNSQAARFAKTVLKARASYSGGVDVWVSGYGQSMTLKEAYAEAFAAVLKAAGINATAQSRMD